MDQKTALVTAKKYAERVQEIIHPSKILLYGLFASGKFHKDSDIDIAIIVEDIDNYFDISIQLNRLTTDIDKRIEPVLLTEKNDLSGFVQNIIKHGILLYNQSGETEYLKGKSKSAEKNQVNEPSLKISKKKD